MTSETGRIVVHISIHPDVAVVGFRIHVACGTRKFRKIGRIRVTICTGRPLPLVFAAINRKVCGIMQGIFSGSPARIGTVALRTIIGELRKDVVWRLSALKIRLVAGIAIAGCTGKITGNVALLTICYFVSFGQGEKIVVHLVRSPIGGENIVAFQAIG